MTEQQHYRIYSHITKTSFLHVEDALDIGKLRIFAGLYKRGNGSSQLTAHWLDLADARVLLNDLAWGKTVDYCEFKGSPGDPPTSRVLKVKSNDKVWFRLETGPGQVIGEGAIKPAGKPVTEINVPFTPWEARKLALATLSYCQAWETARLVRQANGISQALCPRCHTRPCTCDDYDLLQDGPVSDNGFDQDPDQVSDMAPDW
jgi:hypothetical protein